VALIQDLGAGKQLMVETHWGGLGGGLGGWRISRPAIYFVCMLVFGGLFVLVGTRSLETPHGGSASGQAGASQPSKTEAKKDVPDAKAGEIKKDEARKDEDKKEEREKGKSE
jgi:hypothetical protein